MNKKYIEFLNTFSFKQWIWFYVALSLVFFSVVGLFYIFQKRFTHTVPLSGGTYTEGIVGTVRFINPVLATNDTEKDITNLVFRGLFKKDSDNIIIPVLAKNYTVSEDGLVYEITLKEGLKFHNNKPLTTKDIAYTIKQIQDPITKSPRLAQWAGVNTEIVDEQTIKFKLKQKFPDFLDMLTIGIISESEWSGVTSEQFILSEKNLSPVGSGPYVVEEVILDNKGLAKKISLTRFKKYAEGKPYIKKMILTFFANEKDAITALNNNDISTFGGVSPENIDTIKNKKIETTPLPRLFGIFFNKNKVPVFQDPAVISALEYAIDKQTIINQVFNSYAVPKSSAVPFISSTINNSYDPERASSLLEKAGWSKNAEGIWQKESTTLKFTISTTDVKELKMTNILIQEQLRAFGADVLIRTYDTSAFVQDVLNPREYEALLFGQVISKPNNLYAFWHSNERNAPGLNVSMYVSQKVDTLLEKIKKEEDPIKQNENLIAFEAEIEKDKPAIFLFEPMYISAFSKKIFNKNLNVQNGNSRFSNVHMWSINTDHVWGIFAK
jgi:peptide/nickel transport system substrate-binding protein